MRRGASHKILRALSKAFLVLIAFCALFSEWLCNERPLISSYNNKWHITAYTFSSSVTGVPIWRAPIKYSPHTQDPKAVHSLSPIQGAAYGHYFGTDELGHDILSHIVYGCRTACIVGLIAVALACFIGLIIGLYTGFWGDNSLRIHNYILWATLLSIFPVWFYGWHIRQYAVNNAFDQSFYTGIMACIISLVLSTCIFLVIYFVLKVLFKKLNIIKQVIVPLDTLLSRGMDIFLSLPLFYVALLIFTLVKSVTVVHVSVLIGLTSWVSYARLMRAEVMRLRHQPFIEASVTGGASVFGVMLKHILPNAVSPVIVAVVFGIANAILAESAFAVIGLMPTDHISWGTILSDARHTPEAWWLSVFPGLMLTLLLLSLYTLGNSYKQARTGNELIW